MCPGVLSIAFVAFPFEGESIIFFGKHAMSEKSQSVPDSNFSIEKVQSDLRERFVRENGKAKKGQIVFVAFSFMEMFPFVKVQAK